MKSRESLVQQSDGDNGLSRTTVILLSNKIICCYGLIWRSLTPPIMM